jgi:predicted Zn-dependent protease
VRKRRTSRFALHVPRSPWRRLTLLLVVGLVALAFYYQGRRLNPPVEEAPPVRLSVAEEAILGRHAASLLARQHGGLDPDPDGRALLERIGERLVTRSAAGKAPYRFTFHMLADHRVVNVFALPGGPVLMTAGLAARLRTEGEFAAVLAHALAHGIERHPARQLERTLPAEAWPSPDALTAFDPADTTGAGYAAVSTLVAQAVAVTFQPADEAQADTMAVRFMAEAGYNPRALIGALTVLEAASIGGTPAAFFSTHPGPERRGAAVQRAVEVRFPDGVPEELVK